MVLSDGQRFGIFDLTEVEWDKPRLDIRNDELPSRFEEIADFIGAARIAETVRKRQLRHLRRALEAQLDLRALDRTLEDTRTIVNEVRPIVEARRREIEAEARLDVATKGEAARDAVGIWGHAQHFDGSPGSFRWADIDHAVGLVRRQPPIVRTREFDYFEAATTPTGQTHTRMWFPLRVMRLAVAVHLVDNEGCGAECRTAAVAAAEAHASGFANDPLLAAAYRLQRALGPFGFRIAAGFGNHLDSQAQSLLDTLEMEEWLRINGAFGASSDDAYTRIAHFGPRAINAQVSPWTEETLNGFAIEVEKLNKTLPTPARYSHLQLAHDPWLNSWINGDPLREQTMLVPKHMSGRGSASPQRALAESLLQDFFS